VTDVMRLGGLRRGFSTPGPVVAASAVAAAAAVTVTVPSLFFPLLTALGVGALGLLAFRHNVGACALWLLITGCTLEMSLGDILGPTAYQPIIAIVKAVGLMLGGWRYCDSVRAPTRSTRASLSVRCSWEAGHTDCTRGSVQPTACAPSPAPWRRSPFRSAAYRRVGRGQSFT
jgi:hypothetical protein